MVTVGESNVAVEQLGDGGKVMRQNDSRAASINLGSSGKVR